MSVSREFIEELKRNGVKAEVCPPRISFSFYGLLDASESAEERAGGFEPSETKEYNH